MPSEASAGEDTRTWRGRLASGHEAEHAAFVEWLNGPEAQSIFRRRRLTEYTLIQDGDALTVLFRAPHTGDPRLMIDFLRYPGMWPDYWQFERAGGADEVPDPATSITSVHWRRAADESTSASDAAC